MSRKRLRYEPRYSPLPPASEEPTLRAWWRDALVKWLWSEWVAARLASRTESQAVLPDLKGLRSDLLGWFFARSRSRFYLIGFEPPAPPGYDEADNYNVSPFHWEARDWSCMPFYPRLWEDLEVGLAHFRYGEAAALLEAEKHRFKSLDAWLTAELRGELISSGYPEIAGIDLIDLTFWSRFNQRRDQARRPR